MPQTVYFLSSPAFYVSCLHWREGKMEIGRWEGVVVCRKEFMGSKVVVMLRCIFISTTFQCNLLPINWQDPYKANLQLRNTKGKHLVAQTGQSLQAVQRAVQHVVVFVIPALALPATASRNARPRSEPHARCLLTPASRDIQRGLTAHLRRASCVQVLVVTSAEWGAALGYL